MGRDAKSRIAAARHRHALQREAWMLAESRVTTLEAVRTAGNPGTYKRIAMYDFDGTLFKSWEETPKWWRGTPLDSGAYSFFVRPESLDEPCVPDNPGSQYWISKTVSAAKQDSSDRNTYVVLITGRIKAHRKRVLELVRSKGINPEAAYFNPGMSAARFKVAVLKTLLIGFNTVDEVSVWENENAKTYDSALRRTAFAVGRDVEVNIHHVHVPPEPLVCGPEDFGLPAPTAR